MTTLRIATRRSPLALWQAEHVAGALRERNPGLGVELVAMRTSGDKMLDAPLAKVGGKGLFIKELEFALLDGRADIAVHSMKDVPVELPPELHLPVIMARADPRDALVSTRFAGLVSLPDGASVGTSSLRRRCQLAAHRPDLRIENLRGGVDTRLRRLDAGDFDAIVLAVSGLERGGHGARVTEALDVSTMLPAAGQGALGIECRRGDTHVESLIVPLACPRTTSCVVSERAFNRRLEGGCQVPIAAYATLDGEALGLRGLVASLDGTRVLRSQVQGGEENAEALGAEAAAGVLEQGAGEILSEIYATTGQ
ncbi:MAG: hydroxymethylbilane synthase [Acidobacteriota bacterium]|nr:hydroxymethylbilane synthase [Acidobacteriota bacterium]